MGIVRCPRHTPVGTTNGSSYIPETCIARHVLIHRAHTLPIYAHRPAYGIPSVRYADSARGLACQFLSSSWRPALHWRTDANRAYVFAGAPRHWWHRLESSLHTYGLIPARAGRCCHTLFETLLSHNATHIVTYTTEEPHTPFS